MNSRKSHSKMLQSEVFSVGQSVALTLWRKRQKGFSRDQHRKLLQACRNGGGSVDAAVQAVSSEVDISSLKKRAKGNNTGFSLLQEFR